MICEVFISYSTADAASAARMESALREAGLNPWRDKGQIRPGDRFPDEIAAGIESCFAVVWLASTASIASSWVLRELSYATDRGKPIIPIHLDRKSIDSMPGGIKLLLPNIHHILVREDDWEGMMASLIEGLKKR